MRKDEQGNECPATLGEYLDACLRVMGPDNAAVVFLNTKIAESAGGRDELVLADDSQMRALLMPMLLMPVQAPVDATDDDDEG